MGLPSSQASNAIIYLTYVLFLFCGLFYAWIYRHQSKAEYLSSNRTQRGPHENYPSIFLFLSSTAMAVDIIRRLFLLTFSWFNSSSRFCDIIALPLALNFIASGLGSGILFTYPDIGIRAGIQGIFTYALASALPIFAFAWLTPKIRKHSPNGFLLTEWARVRFGTAAGLYLSALTLITMFLYMVAELSAMKSVINTLTGLDPLAFLIVEVVVTTIYTSLGGFRISFITDIIQGGMVLLLVVICSIAIGTKVDIDPKLIEPSGLTKASLLGWKLLYILPVAIVTNFMFLSPFWMRAFAARTDKDLYIGASLAVSWVFIILTVVGFTGPIAVWGHGVDLWGPLEEWSPVSFFYLISQLPGWVIGLTLCLVASLSVSVFDSLQAAMVSTASNDLFRNKMNLLYIRIGVVLLIIPVVVCAIKADASILQIFLISDVVSAAAIPVLLLGLVPWLHFLRGFDVIIGGCGGILSVFIFGTVYYGSAKQGGELIAMTTLYAEDWGVFGAYVVAPFGGIIFGFAACALRLGVLFVKARVRGERFDALDKPAPRPAITDDINGEGRRRSYGTSPVEGESENVGNAVNGGVTKDDTKKSGRKFF